MPDVVRTPSGTLRGESLNGIRIFRGIPFAEPPIGPLRFRAPIPAKPWIGERDATRLGPSPMQWQESSPPGETLVHSEDCLYLNLWAPEGKGPFPVFVWIHGGGYTSGHAFDPASYGSAFALEGIVCVTVAYRLGVFGFLDFGPLLDLRSDELKAGARPRASEVGSANNALRDLMAALTWIQENVAAFGGDPARVTVGGESAGAKLTDILMGVPAAQPLFHQMISESGGAERVWSVTDSAAVAIGYGEQWRKQTGNDLPSLLTAPGSQLIATQREFLAQWPQHFPLRPEIDGRLLQQLPIKSIAAGSSRGKRLLVGTNRDESALFIGPRPSHNAAPKDLGNLLPTAFDEVFARYPEVYPHMTPEQLRIRALTAEEYWVPSVRLAEAQVRSGGNAPSQTWMYRLDFAESSGRLAGFAYHSLDVGLVWGHPHLNPESAIAEAVFAKQMHQAWAAFIRGEAPSAPGLPAWPAYTLANRATMVLDTHSRIEQQPQEAELRLWDGIL